MDRLALLPGVEITREGGVWMREERAYVVADLHLGYEAAARREGAFMPPMQLKAVLAALDAIIRTYAPRTIVVNGDLKHSFDRNLRQEWEEVSMVLDHLMRDVETVEVLRGNHDNYLAAILAKRGMELKPHTVIGGLKIAHGHKRVERDGWLLQGHEHPCLKVRDALGAELSLPCFLWSRAERIIVLPAISPIVFGRNVLSPGATPLSPAIKHFKEFETAGLSSEGLMRFGRVRDLRGTHVS
ncbi:MAG: metallophosphoesterase [Candidatus Thermoplasmatota archaeon]